MEVKKPHNRTLVIIFEQTMFTSNLSILIWGVDLGGRNQNLRAQNA